MNNTGNQEINPITRLDYPDPDVIRVDNTYYMVSSCKQCKREKRKRVLQ